MLIRFDPFREMDELMRWALPSRHFSAMPMDAYRRGDEFVVEFDLPGVDRDSIDVTVERNVLQVTAQRARRHEDGDKVIAAERPHGTVSRELILGDSLDTQNIRATYDDGVLRLVIPVAEEAKPQKIEIAAGNGARPAVTAAAAA